VYALAVVCVALWAAASPLLEFESPDADQGVAVDAKHVYAIDNTVIAKHDKFTGERVARWEADRTLPLIHMNAGIVQDGILYCAHSNYPLLPMTGSIELFNAATLQHVDSISLANPPGSLTWFIPRKDSFWACFAHYDHRPPEDRSARFTTIVRYNDKLLPMESWILPESVLKRIAPYSLSGGAWGADGLLYVAGHDLPELYALEVPKAGSVMRHVKTLSFPNEGQGIAYDAATGLMYGIRRSEGVVVARVLAELRAVE